MNNIYIEPVKRITKKQAEQLPELFNSKDISCDTLQLFAVYLNKPYITSTKQTFVGAMMVDFESFTIHNGKPWFDIYIDKFEVAKGWHGKGIGKAMFNGLCWKYDIRKVNLCHVMKEKDGGASYRFWRHMGFHKPEAAYQQLTKTITKL